MNLQHLYDALKAVRETGESWVTWNGERLRLRRLEEADKVWQEAEPGRAKPEGLLADAPVALGDKVYWASGPFDAFVKARVPGGVTLARVWWHEANLLIQANGKRQRRAGDKVVLAIVAERHPREG